jgi:hypothetical protein
MAKRTTKSKALGYQETFFANRNDMLQSALDAVLLKIDNEQARYQAEVELYKESSKLVVREKERLQKLVDSLKKGQIDKDLSVAQFNAGQQNSAARTAASIEAANARFNAKQAALAAYYGTRGFSAGRDPQNAITLNEVQQAYNAHRGDINATLNAYYQQTQVTTGVPKTVDDIQKGFAQAYNMVVAEEATLPKYDIFGEPQDRINAAKDTVFERISSQSSKDFVELGLVKLNPQAAAGAGLVIDETGKVNVGGIDVKTLGQVDYSPLIADAEKRLGRIKEAEGKAPVAPEEPDLIDLQRREYFDKFYSGYVPRYEMNEIMQRLIDLPDAEAQAFKDLYQSRYSPVAGMETPTGARPVRDLPTTPGGVIGGEGSPFVPTDRFSARGREILGNIPSNQFYLEDMANPTEAGLQERANLLFGEGFGLQKTLKEDGRILYTVVPFDQLGLYPADQVVMPQRQTPESVESLNQQISALQKEMAAATAGAAGGLSPFNIFASLAGEGATADLGMQSLAGKQAALDSLIAQRDALLAGPKDVSREDMRLAQQNVRMDQSQPLDQSIDDLVQELARIDGALKKAYSPVPVSADVAGLGPVSISKEQISALENSKRQIEDQLDNLLMTRIEAGSGPEQQVVKRSDMVLVPAQSYLGDFGDMGTVRRETEPVLDFAEPRRLQPVTGDRAEVRRIRQPPTPERRTDERYKAPMDYDQSEILPEPKTKKITLDEGPKESLLEISKTQFVEDPTDANYRYRSNQTGGFEVEFKGAPAKPAPAGSDAAKAIERVLTPRKVMEEIKIESKPTPEQTDAKVKFNAAEKAQSIYGTPEFDKLLKTELGRAVSDLYSVNKSKGDESGGEVLSYIATEFPRAEDQSKAAQILMGLSYADKTKGLLKA